MQFLAKDFVNLDGDRSDPCANGGAERTALAADSLRSSGRLRLKVHGESMLPTLWPGTVVEIASCPLDDVRPGEVVLAQRAGRFFLHRFLARSQSPPGGFVLRGDSMPGPDPQFPDNALLGRMVSSGRRLSPLYWAVGQLLCYCGPARRLALRVHDRRKRHGCGIQEADEKAKFATSAAEAANQDKPDIAALKSCATQNRASSQRQPVAAALECCATHPSTLSGAS